MNDTHQDRPPLLANKNPLAGRFMLSVEEVKARATALLNKPVSPSFEEVRRKAVEMLSAKPREVETEEERIKRRACEMTMQGMNCGLRVRSDIFKVSHDDTEASPADKEESPKEKLVTKKRTSESGALEEVRKKKQKHPEDDGQANAKSEPEKSIPKEAKKRSQAVENTSAEDQNDRESPELEIISEKVKRPAVIIYGPPVIEVEKANHLQDLHSFERETNCAEPFKTGHAWPIKSQAPRSSKPNNMKYLRGAKETPSSSHTMTNSNTGISPTKKQPKISGYFSPTKGNASKAQEPENQEMQTPELPSPDETAGTSAKSSSKIRKSTGGEEERKSTLENLTRFKEILISVTMNKHYNALINPEDHTVICNFLAVSERSKALLIQLSKIKHIWRRVSDLKHPEIAEDLGDVIDELIRADFLKKDTELTDLREMLELLKVKEIADLLKVYKLESAKKKAGNIEVLLKHCQQQSTIRGNMSFMIEKRARLILGECVMVNLATVDVLKRMCLLESLPLCFKDTSLSDILYRANMLTHGTLVYPDCKINMQRQIFQNRDSFLEFHRAYLIFKEMETERVAKNYLAVAQLAKEAWKYFKALFEPSKTATRAFDEALPEYLRRYTAGHTLAHAMTNGIEALSKLKEFDSIIYILKDLLDQSCYCVRLRGDWYEKMALIYSKHIKNVNEVVRVIFKGMTDPKVDMRFKMSLANRAASFKTSKLLDKDTKEKLDYYANSAVLSEPPCIVIKGRVKSRGEGVVGQKMNFLLEDASTGETLVSSVESCAIAHYLKNERFEKGRHNEGSTIVTLFGILFWNEVYDQDIPDAFISRYQSEPLDLYGIDFYERRRDRLERQMQRIERWNSDESKAHFVNTWEMCADKVCLVNNSAFKDAEEAHSLFECMGAKTVNKICLRLMKDYRKTRSGFPDLVVWTPGKKDKYKFVESKLC
ncbi:Hypothetical predicted protein [Cloeon dipterum]|uniref:Fanconi-associated nuclease n=1 Tax=Cloeon dipterum TaxID=197152 RepID=A0A8S1CJN9_9INSE|nr:Hypothetical predicted protein [Cloeon dipterum]